MTFPTTPVLDDFNRANSSSTIGGNWSVFQRNNSYDMGIISNAAYNPDTQYNSLYYNTGTFGADSEAFVTFSTLMPQGKTFNLFVRLKDVTPGAWAYDGYAIQIFRWDNSGTDTVSIKLKRVDNSSETQLGSTVNITDHGNGDKAGLRTIGSSIVAFYDDGAGWEQRISSTDATYSAAGYIGFFDASETTARWDDFGGGTFNPIPRIMHHRKQQGTS